MQTSGGETAMCMSRGDLTLAKGQAKHSSAHAEGAALTKCKAEELE